MIKKFKTTIMPYLIAYLGRLLMRLISLTCKVNIEGMDKFKEVAKKNKCILMLWHNRLCYVAEIFTRKTNFQYSAFVSNSRDGDMLAIFAESYKQGQAIRVPHNDRAGALQKMIRVLRMNKRIIIITPDGPKGPIYKVKPGVAVAAKEGEAVIFPFSWKADRVWRLGTWDRLMLPKPFSTIEAKIGEPISFENDGEMVEENELEELGQALFALHKE